MRELTTQELRQIQLEILDVVAKFCDDNQITYWIDCGTLLGAIRHKGYIPWDDDIDVGMLRPDYDKFIKLFNAQNTRYKFHCPEIDPKFFCAFGKVYDTQTFLYEEAYGRKINYAIDIDIFPYDNAPDDDNLVREMYIKRDYYYRRYSTRIRPIMTRFKGNVVKKIFVYAFRFALKLLPKNYFLRKIIANSKSYASQDTKRVGNFTCAAKIACDKRVFDSFIEVEFEGRKYKAMAGYDEWLRAFYGDYMQLPPVEKRVNPHKLHAFKYD